jgi:hypothetical protein
MVTVKCCAENQHAHLLTAICGTQVGKVGIVTSFPADVIPKTDLYIVTVPAFAHEKYMKCVTDRLKAATL